MVMKMEGYGFLADGGATVWSVEMVGCCLFSNSRRFTACFLQNHVTQTSTINLISQEIE